MSEDRQAEHSSPAPEPPRGNEPRRSPVVFIFVNFLRGVAALLVYFFHLQLLVITGYPLHPVPPGSWTWRLIHHDFNLGRYAVATFFIISGFLIPETLRKPRMTLGRFVIHRFFRLYPCYWFSLAVVCLLALCKLEELAGNTPGMKFKWMFINFTMMQKFVGIPDEIGASWTLQIEMIFYFACGAMFVAGLLAWRRTALIISLCGAVVLAVSRSRIAAQLPVAIPLALALMALGDIIRAYSRGDLLRGTVILWTFIVAVALIPICLFAYDDFGWGAALSNAAAIATFLFAYQLREFFANLRILRATSNFLGEISYSFYLLHGPIGLEIARAVYDRTGSATYAMAVSLVPTITLSWIVYQLVESPAIMLGRRLTGEASARQIAVAEAARPDVYPIVDVADANEITVD
ncbi:MAG: acyltransferase [Phycisphaerae bacterium]|nr:acyltransferase [Phycisphaerae bacterium]